MQQLGRPTTDIRHSKTDPDVTSMKLSIPKPTREMLPATTPAMTATKPSRVFQTTVKYSSFRPWRTTAERSNRTVSAMSSVYDATAQTWARVPNRGAVVSEESNRARDQANTPRERVPLLVESAASESLQKLVANICGQLRLGGRDQGQGERTRRGPHLVSRANRRRASSSPTGSVPHLK